jgi:preprotein translocase subunit SecE
MTKHRKKSALTKDKAQSLLPSGPGDAPAKPRPPAQPGLKPKKVAEEVKPPSRLSRLISFFKDAKRELSWVSWPSRKDTIKSTGVLLVLVGIAAAYLGLVDGLLSFVLRLIVG